MNRILHKISYLSIPLLAVLLLLSGCGGGNNDDNDTPAPTGTISGAVSGTTLMVVNQQDEIIATYDTVGQNPDFDRDNNGSLESFSFKLTGVTVGENIRVYLVSGGKILSLYFDTNGDGVLDTNVFHLNDVTNVSLGFVDTELLESEGMAVPQLSPTANAQVSPADPNPVVPMAVNKPLTTGLSVGQLNEKGLHALSDGWIGGAKTYFGTAYQQVNSSDASSQADTARFFLALTRVAAFAMDTLSDGNPSDLNYVGDILDLAGIPNDTKRASWQLIVAPTQLAASSPKGNELRDFLYQVFKPELQAAIANLNEVSPGFNITWNQPAPGEEDDTIENDYGDVLFLRGLCKAVLAAIAIQNSYNLDADIATAANPNLDDNPANDTTIKGFLSNHPIFLSLIQNATLAEAKSALAGALDDFSMAIDVINTETDAQGDDVVTLDSLTIRDQNTLAEAKGYLANAKQSLALATTIVDYNQTVEPDKEDITLNLQKFFDIGVDFRKPAPGLLPPFEANRVNGLFPDPTFGGVVLSPDLNKDEDGDGVPDILPSGLTNAVPD